MRSCLACTRHLQPTINAFCFTCNTPNPPDWTTGNKPLDSFIIESWDNVKEIYDSYIQWIEYSLLTNVQEMTSLRHGCTRLANWLDVATNEWVKVMLKQISDTQLVDIYQVNYFTCE